MFMVDGRILWARIERMEDVTREYYESIGLGEAYVQQVAREALEDQA
jgi:hypothetical protein